MVDDGLKILMILLTFSKAFDVAYHVVVLDTLRDIETGAMLLNWIWESLSNHSMWVNVGEASTSFKRVSSGVPQGSILGPVFFLVYVNNLTEGLFSNHGDFANDIKFTCIMTEMLEKMKGLFYRRIWIS